MSEMVERVAKGMRDSITSDSWDDLSEGRKEDFRRAARGAIEAEREPTEAMKKLMAASDVKWLPEFWESMVDEMLK